MYQSALDEKRYFRYLCKPVPHVIDAPERYLRRQAMRYFLADDLQRLRRELRREFVGARGQLFQWCDGVNLTEQLEAYNMSTLACQPLK